MNQEQHVVYLHLDDIIPNRFQPREVFEEKALKELAVSIKEHGVIQPIIVREINNNKYEIIAGERRYKASALAGMTTIPAIIRNLDDKESAKVALLENLQRKNLNPIEEARTYQKIIELDQMTQEELAKTMGKSQSAVANKIRLLGLPDEIQNALLKEEISERHARALLNLSDSNEQSKMLKKIIEEKMTVRKLEDEIKKINMPNTQDKIKDENDLQSLINPQPVKTVENNDNSFLMNPISDNNSNNEDIINYGEINDDTDDDADEGEELSLLSPTPDFSDLNKLKSQSTDIGDITKENPNNTTNDVNPLDSLLNLQSPISTPEEKKITPAEQALKESEDNHENTEDYFSAPDLMSVNMNQSSKEATNSVNSTFGQKSFDSLIDFSRNTNSNETKETNNSFENKDTSLGAALLTEAYEKNIANTNYSVKDMVDTIRNTLKELEQHGAKIDTDEMNFENEYQILIKIDKNNSN